MLFKQRTKIVFISLFISAIASAGKYTVYPLNPVLPVDWQGQFQRILGELTAQNAPDAFISATPGKAPVSHSFQINGGLGEIPQFDFVTVHVPIATPFYPVLTTRKGVVKGRVNGLKFCDFMASVLSRMSTNNISVSAHCRNYSNPENPKLKGTSDDDHFGDVLVTAIVIPK